MNLTCVSKYLFLPEHEGLCTRLVFHFCTNLVFATLIKRRYRLGVKSLRCGWTLPKSHWFDSSYRQNFAFVYINLIPLLECFSCLPIAYLFKQPFLAMSLHVDRPLFGSLNVTFLGTASAQPSSTRNHSALALRLGPDVWLFDCGEATQHQLQKSTVKMGKIEKVFITHTHGR